MDTSLVFRVLSNWVRFLNPSLCFVFVPCRKDGNSWSSGPAPPAPPGSQTSSHHKSGNNGKSSESSSSGGGKSGISAGAIVGIILGILVVVAVIGFFLFKRRIRRPSPDLEKVDIHKPFVAAAASNDVEGNSWFFAILFFPLNGPLSSGRNILNICSRFMT